MVFWELFSAAESVQGRESLDLLRIAATVGLASDVLMILGAVLIMAIVRRICIWQQAASAIVAADFAADEEVRAQWLSARSKGVNKDV